MARPGHAPPSAAFALLEKAARLLAIGGGLLAIAMAFTVTVSVSMRWGGFGGVRGDFELVQMGTALVFFACLPLCQMRRGNVIVDTFTTRLPARVRAAIDALWDLVFAAAMALIAWRLMVGALEAWSSHTTTMVLLAPIAPAIAACAVMSALLALVSVATAAERLRTVS